MSTNALLVYFYYLWIVIIFKFGHIDLVFVFAFFISDCKHSLFASK